MPNRKAAYGGPAEEKEVIVTFDKRLLYVGGALVLVLALVGGMWFARQSAAPPEAAQAPVQGAQSDVVSNLPKSVALATAQKLGLPTDVTIVQSVTRTLQTAPPPPGAGTPGAPDPFGTARAQAAGAAGAPAGTPSGNPTLDAARAMGAKEMAFPTDYKGKAEGWTHDVLAGFPDANLADPKVVPERAEFVKGTLQGPRIAINELNDQYTYDFGVVPLDHPSIKEFVASNVGDADLIISRVYTGCGCTALTIGSRPISGGGFLTPPVVLKPGEKVPFTVQFDPRAEGKTGAQSKFVQIFTNDATKTMFDAKDANSYETRFRFVVEPRGKLGAATVTPAPAKP
jgi:hypothetical protein